MGEKERVSLPSPLSLSILDRRVGRVHSFVRSSLRVGGGRVCQTREDERKEERGEEEEEEEGG